MALAPTYNASLSSHTTGSSTNTFEPSNGIIEWKPVIETQEPGAPSAQKPVEVRLLDPPPGGIEGGNVIELWDGRWHQFFGGNFASPWSGRIGDVLKLPRLPVREYRIEARQMGSPYSINVQFSLNVSEPDFGGIPLDWIQWRAWQLEDNLE